MSVPDERFCPKGVEKKAAEAVSARGTLSRIFSKPPVGEVSGLS